MKNRLCIASFILLSFSIFSCSTDDMDEQTEAKTLKITSEKDVKNYLHKDINVKAIDSTGIILDANSTAEGDPSNPKPPRKD
ncbi:hypothetical protein GJU43_18235 [Flavobacterium sp. LC2016-23]|uniref:hypothetical protein n=1 Tax=Flavobacterium sp. LC2016-23 TaxID=2666330 RepID=UPI0012B148B3|nr:hypothetical protein [Flavobacterium sp. LC2016-23]MRX41230.1 hypothetical protein [Flavobacterium sp. LC2016-23]